MTTAYECKVWIRNALARCGLRRRRRPDQVAQFLQRYAIGLVLDVGANAGQYARRIRSMGYRGRIVSFEPLPDAFVKLQANARGFPEWQVANLALGAADGVGTLHVAGNSQSSSLLPMAALHLAAAPESAYVGAVTVPVRRLDGILHEYCQPADRVFLKMDVQGGERDVLAGAGAALDRFVGVQLEMAFEPMYEGETLFPAMCDYMCGAGYSLMSLAGVWRDRRTGQILQVEGVFCQTREVAARRAAA